MTESQRVEELYHAALGRPESEREAFLADACGPDPELLHEVKSLLSYADAVEEFLDQPVMVP